MSYRPPLESFLKWKLDVQSPSLKYAAKAETRTVIMALDIPFPLLKATHEFLKRLQNNERDEIVGESQDLVKILSEVKCAERKNTLTQIQKAHKEITAFVNTIGTN